MRYFLGVFELIIAFFFLLVTVEMFSGSGYSSAGAGGNQASAWQFLATTVCLSLFGAAIGLLATGNYWWQLLLLPAFFVFLFFVLG